MTTVEELRAAPVEPRPLRGYRIWEPSTGYPEDFGDIVVEMLRRGYEITLIPFGRAHVRS
jgi:hypothetical protein